MSRGLLFATNSRQVTKDGRFYDIARTGPVPIRSRADAPSPTLRRPDHLPPSEIRAAIHDVIHDHVAADRADTARQVSRMFGFKSLSSGLAAVIEEQVDHMVANGQLAEDRGRLRLVG